MGIDNVTALKNMGEYEEGIPEDVQDAMVRNNLTRGQAEHMLAQKKRIENARRGQSDS